MEIVKQGAVRVNGCVVVYQNDRVACLELDLHSKYAEQPTVGMLVKGGVSYPVIYLNAGDHTLHIDSIQPREATTELQFNDFADWDIFCCDGPYRYTVRLVLMRIQREG